MDLVIGMYLCDMHDGFKLDHLGGEVTVEKQISLNSLIGHEIIAKLLAEQGVTLSPPYIHKMLVLLGEARSGNYQAAYSYDNMLHFVELSIE